MVFINLIIIIFSCKINMYMCRDSAVGIATLHRLDRTGIESRWWARFSAPVQTDPGPYSSSYTMCTGSFPRVKRPERAVDNPPTSSTEVKERVELYFYSSPTPSDTEHSLRYVWMSDQPEAENIHKGQTSVLPASFEPSIPTNERPQTHGL